MTDFKEAQKKMEEEESKEERSDQKKKSKKDIVIDMSVNKKHTKLRKILDQSIQKHGGYEKLPIKKEDLQKNLKTFVEPVKKVEEMRKNYHGHIVEFSGKKAPKPEKAMPQTKPSAKTVGKSSSSAGSSSGGGKSGGNKAKAKPKAKKKDKKDDKKKESAPSYANGGRTIIVEKDQTGKSAGVNATNGATATATAEANIPSVNNPQSPPEPAQKQETAGGKGKGEVSGENKRSVDDLLVLAGDTDEGVENVLGTGDTEERVENVLGTGDTGGDTRESLGEAGGVDGRTLWM